MKTIGINTIGLVTTLIMLLFLNIDLSAQSQLEIVGDLENVLVLHLEEEAQTEKPNRILLVYDSNLITLESSSMNKTSGKSSISNSYASASFVSIMAEEFEPEIELEKWMLEPFEKKTSIGDMPEDEEEIAMEDWMTNLSLWK